MEERVLSPITSLEAAFTYCEMSVEVVEPQQARTLCMFIIVTLQGCWWQLYSGNTELGLMCRGVLRCRGIF